MADFITNTSETLAGDVFLEIGSGVSNTLIDSFVDRSTKLTIEFELKQFDRTVKTNLTVSFTNLSAWTSLISTIKDEVFVVKVGGVDFFRGILDKPSLVKDFTKRSIKFRIVQTDYSNKTYSSTGSGTITFSTYLADIVSNTTGSAISYEDSISWDLEDGTTTFLNFADVGGGDSSIRLDRGQASSIKYISTLRKTLQFDLIEWRGTLYVLNPIRNTSDTTTLIEKDILSEQEFPLYTTEDNSQTYVATMLPRTEGLLDGLDQIKFDYNVLDVKREFPSVDLIPAFDNHLYSYNTSASRTPNWDDTNATAPNSITLFYIIGSGSKTEELARLRSIDNEDIFIELDTSFLNATYVVFENATLNYNIRINKINATNDDLNGKLYIETVGNPRKFIEDIDFGDAGATMIEGTYDSPIGGDLRIGYQSAIVRYVISSAVWVGALGSLRLFLTQIFEESLFELGRSYQIDDVTNYTGSFILTKIDSDTGTNKTILSFETADNGVASLSASPSVYTPQDVQVGISDINIRLSIGKVDVKIFAIDDDLDIGEQVEITTSDTNDLNNELVDLFLERAVDNIIALNLPTNKVRKVIRSIGEVNPYKAVSRDSLFFKITKYKYDLNSDITDMEMIEQ